LDIRRLEVAVHDALLVGHLQRLGNLARDGERVRGRHRATRQTRGEILALDQLHGQEANITVSMQTMDHCDVRVLQRRQ
jgi:hypothetical protein